MVQNLGGLVLGAGDDVGAFFDHALRVPDLARHRGPDLIQQPEKLLLLDHHPGAERHPPPDADQLLEPIEQDEDVVRFFLGNVGFQQVWRCFVGHRPPLQS